MGGRGGQRELEGRRAAPSLAEEDAARHVFAAARLVVEDVDAVELSVVVAGVCWEAEWGSGVNVGVGEGEGPSRGGTAAPSLTEAVTADAVLVAHDLPELGWRRRRWGQGDEVGRGGNEEVA